MQNEKKLTKDDTWRSADLRKYIKGQDGDEGKHRGGESSERRHRDPDKESRREKEKQRERDSTRERRDEDDRHRYGDRRREGSKDRRSDRVRREERDGEKQERDKLLDEKFPNHDYKEDRQRRRDREERRHSDRDRDRHRDKDKVREKERRKGHEGDNDKSRDERDKDRRREERDRGHAAEREKQRHRERGDGDGDRHRAERHDREKRERHRERERYKEEMEDKRNNKERRERHEDRRHLDIKERDRKEEHTRHREEKERQHSERRHHDEKREHNRDSRDSGGHRGVKGLPEEDVRHRRVGGRERAERDEHRERGQRADRVPERNHDRDTTKKSASEKSHRHEAKAEVTAPELHTVAAEAGGIAEKAVFSDEADQEYEDDFEDYEEDFEETDESMKDSGDERETQKTDEDKEMEEPKMQRTKEIEAIQKAMDIENQRVGTTQTVLDTNRKGEDGQKLSRESERNQSRDSQRGKFIDFVAAKQREVSKQAASKQKKRSAELFRLIELDFSTTFTILDLPPVSEYDMYIKNFGNANTKQAYVQCNEDNTDRDIQTEEIKMCEKWTQHPPECDGPWGDPNLSQEARDKSLSETGFHSQRLVAFLRSASQVMMVLLEEEQAERTSLRKPRSQSQSLSFSDGSLQLNTRLPFLHGRSVSLVHFSQVQRFTMMSVHSPTTKPSAVRLDSCTIICIWNIWEPSRPQKVLIYESDVQCCCFSPGKATLVFAGTSVGSVLLWDLREQASIHYRLTIGQEEWTFRQPTFSTDAVMANWGHVSPVTAVEVVPSSVGGCKLESSLLTSEEESSGLSFQLATLDETGVLNFWVVIELPKASKAGSATDLGLRPGGKVKLLHSSSLQAAERSPRDAVKAATLQTSHLKFLPTDSSHFFIGTNMGLVNHGTTHGLKAPPKFYRCREAGARAVEVTSIHFSPFSPQFFLVGCLDGSIRLHAVCSELPVAEWHNPAAVVSLQWSQTKPTVFCMLDAASNLHVWDLLKSDTEPVVTETMNSDRVTAMVLFGDSGQQNTYAGVVLVHQSGTIDIQYFPKHLALPSATEVEKLERMMAEASLDS